MGVGEFVVDWYVDVYQDQVWLYGLCFVVVILFVVCYVELCVMVQQEV